MYKLSFYSFYDYYTADYSQFIANLSNKLGGTFHVKYNKYFDGDYALPEKHYINFFQSDLFYLNVNFFIGDDDEINVFYTLKISSDIYGFEDLEIHFLPNGVVRIFEFEENSEWFTFVDILFINSLNHKLFNTILRLPYVHKFLRILSKAECNNLYFFPKDKYAFEYYLNNIFLKECCEEDLLEYQKTEDKIKLYNNISILEYLNPTINIGLLNKRKKKVDKYGIFKFIINKAKN